ncbi:hypothetical protein MLP_27080 [Microlunatus phosphovorus NM-1]|uniref:NodB homology domain-containing protein n=1 Tax=Microlunatus phosphovorus (strain ATCC 700054 / DSM 10555 / JCM 9379 / NBRC 101784 / NCIMB 13414 / VKM Ac-1990 / NM-1) TaxID=1032480 RepID=F5XI53_MICPN|nr:hypothetical protein MLP_27080 [Microlunatus phosphovorus NM-1]
MQLSKVSQAVRHRLYQPVRRRVRRCLPRGGILMYHRICQESCDPWAITVAPTDFADQMAVLAEARAVVDLAAFSGSAAYTRSGAQLAVTFDDGYVDNLETALPILERYEIPATMFVVGNAIGRRREFWWDALQRAILESGPLPSELAFEFGTGPHVYPGGRRAGRAGRPRLACGRVLGPNTATATVQPALGRDRRPRTRRAGRSRRSSAELGRTVAHPSA